MVAADDPEPGGGPSADRLVVSSGFGIDPGELRWRFSASGGPGGQHVNTSNTRAEVLWDVTAARDVPVELRERLLARLGPVVSVVASDTRSQARNRDLAQERLLARIRAALVVPKARRATRPTLASKRRRLDAKRRRGDRKRGRRSGSGWDDG